MEMAHLMVERMMKTIVLVLWRQYLEYFPHRTHFSLEWYRLTSYTICSDRRCRNEAWHSHDLMSFQDNGGRKEAGSNWPLRGRKKTLWEGGIRGVGFIHGNSITYKSWTCTGLMDISDWYPTLVNLAGGQVNESMGLDGYDMWNTLR